MATSCLGKNSASLFSSSLDVIDILGVPCGLALLHLLFEMRQSHFERVKQFGCQSHQSRICTSDVLRDFPCVQQSTVGPMMGNTDQKPALVGIRKNGEA
ncbi:MAG: hypothetical protein MI753_12400 [Hyphomicrobiales bacterium]|nr:hypothetical protein [Hyphomicrobiales bacterium]